MRGLYFFKRKAAVAGLLPDSKMTVVLTFPRGKKSPARSIHLGLRRLLRVVNRWAVTVSWNVPTMRNELRYSFHDLSSIQVFAGR